jgi:hypothetical protein
MEFSTEQGSDDIDDGPSAPPRLPPMGKYEGLAPLHTTPFAIEQNVARIATQIALGRPATYD